MNGFVNAAFGEDKLLTDDGNKWIYKHKGTGMMSATASLGLILLWDVEGGLTQIDKFLYSNEDYIKVLGRCWGGAHLVHFEIVGQHFLLAVDSVTPPYPHIHTTPPPHTHSLVLC